MAKVLRSIFCLAVLCSVAGTAAAQGANANTELDTAERQRVITGAIANLKQFYFDKDVGQKIADD
jgi:hypothetical protein